MKKIVFEKDITLYKADCLEVMPLLPESSIDLVLCDPPFGITASQWDKIIPFSKMWEEIRRVRKDNAPTALFGSEPFSSLLRCGNLAEFRYDWVWEKSKASNFLLAKKQPLKADYPRLLRVRRRRQHDPPAQRGGRRDDIRVCRKAHREGDMAQRPCVVLRVRRYGRGFALRAHVGRRRHIRPQAHVPGGSDRGARQPRGADGVPPPRRPCVEEGRCQRRGTPVALRRQPPATRTDRSAR